MRWAWLLLAVLVVAAIPPGSSDGNCVTMEVQEDDVFELVDCPDGWAGSGQTVPVSLTAVTPGGSVTVTIHTDLLNTEISSGDRKVSIATIEEFTKYRPVDPVVNVYQDDALTGSMVSQAIPLSYELEEEIVLVVVPGAGDACTGRVFWETMHAKVEGSALPASDLVVERRYVEEDKDTPLDLNTVPDAWVVIDTSTMNPETLHGVDEFDLSQDWIRRGWVAYRLFDHGVEQDDTGWVSVPKTNTCPE